MRTLTKEYTVYNFEDIQKNEDLKQKILEKHYDINITFEWYQDIIEYWKEKLENLGFMASEINFSGFWSQGDGASFTCKYIDIPQAAIQSQLFTNREINIISSLYNYGYIEAAIKRTSCHYYHEDTTTLEYYDGQLQINWARIQKIVNKLWDYLEDIRYSFSKEIYTELKEEYEYQTSEEAILEAIEANEYEFYEDGGIV